MPPYFQPQPQPEPEKMPIKAEEFLIYICLIFAVLLFCFLLGFRGGLTFWGGITFTLPPLLFKIFPYYYFPKPKTQKPKIQPKNQSLSPNPNP